MISMWQNVMEKSHLCKCSKCDKSSKKTVSCPCRAQMERFICSNNTSISHKTKFLFLTNKTQYERTEAVLCHRIYSSVKFAPQEWWYMCIYVCVCVCTRAHHISNRKWSLATEILFCVTYETINKSENICDIRPAGVAHGDLKMMNLFLCNINKTPSANVNKHNSDRELIEIYALN